MRWVDMLCVLWLLIFCNYVYSDEGTPFLKFQKITNITDRRSSFTYIGNTKPIEIDGTFPQVLIQVMEMLNNQPPNLLFHCLVDPLSQDSLITSAQLCIKYHGSSKIDCDDANKPFLHSDKNRFLSSGDRSIGYTFVSNWVRGSTSLDAIYFCRLSNKNGVIVSSYIEIQDIEFYSSKFDKRRPLDPVNLGPLVGSSFPLSLECGDSSTLTVQLPPWAERTFRSPYLWVYCEVPAGSSLELRRCYDKAVKPNELVDKIFETTVLPNGTMIIHERTPMPWRPIGILCVSTITSKTVFSAYFQKDGDRSVPFEYTDGTFPTNPPIIVRSSRNPPRLDLRAGTYGRDAISLNALYTANPANVEFKWTKDGRSIPAQFTATRHSLIFSSELKSFHSGTYELTVTAPGQVETFRYEVLVSSPPQVKKTSSAVVYVLDGGSVHLETEFEGQLTSRSLQINGLSIDTLSNSQFEDSLRVLREQYPYIGDLHPQIDFPTDNSLRYVVNDLTFSPNSAYGSSHTVSMIGENLLGAARTETVVRVLPVPRVTRMMSDYDCKEDCFNQTTHHFYCDIDLSPYKGLKVMKTWELEGHDLSRLHKKDSRFTFLTYNDHEVILHIARDNSTFDKLFASVKLNCRFRIYEPYLELFDSTPPDSAKLYDTKTNNALNRKLTAFISKDPSGGSRLSTAASFSWIAAVVIAICILIAVAILAVCIVMRNKGETYMLDREERALGNDPEKEFRHRDNFQVYERTEEPVIASNISLNDTFQDIGSDDEGELDSYNLDPGNFNETGSFIGEYTRGQRRKLGVTPTNPSVPI